MTLDTSKRGFASMDEEKRKKIASMGGQASGGNFARNPQRASEAGRKGGQHSHQGRKAKLEREMAASESANNENLLHNGEQQDNI